MTQPRMIARSLAAAALLLLPLEAAAFRLAFRGMGLNYPEWLVLATYITVQAFVIMTVTIVLRHWLPQAQAWGLWLSLAYALNTVPGKKKYENK